MSAVYFDEWSCKEDMLEDFCIEEEGLNGMEVLFAICARDNYEGLAFVLMKSADGRLFIVDGSPDSCGDLGGQWFPEETIPEILKKQLSYSYMSDRPHGKSRLLEILSDIHVH